MKRFLSRLHWPGLLATFFTLMSVLAACGKLPPSVTLPAPEEHSILEETSPTSTPAPSTTPLAAGVLTPTPALTPPLSAYQLRPWTEKEGAELGDKVIDAGDTLSGVPHAEWRDYALVFNAEYLLRFPQAQDWREVASETAFWIDPLGMPLPGMRPGQDLFSFLLEEDLNRENAGLAEVEAALSPQPFSLESILPVPDLFGDGQVAPVFQIRAAENQCAVLAARLITNRLRLEMVHPWEECQWPARVRSYKLEQHASPDGGLPLLLVTVIDGYSGLPNRESWSLELSRWAGDHFTVQSLVLLGGAEEQTCGREGRGQSPCEGEWRFDAHALITTESWYTQGDCPDLTLEHSYRLEGGQYIPTGEHFLPAASTDPFCRAAWAEAVILFGKPRWNDDQAIHTLSTALQEWPAGNTPWGPAGGDYLRLRLGIWQDLRGESQPALALLQALADLPADPQYTLPARLAADYLQGRTRQGILGACTQVERSWQAAQQKDLAGDLFKAYNTLPWGFTNAHWEEFSLGNICNPMDALPAGAAEAAAASVLPVDGQAGLQTWLAEVGLPVYSVQPADLNGDGVTDWAVLFDLHPLDLPSQIWAFTPLQGTLQATFVSTLGLPAGDAAVTLQSYRPLPIALPVQVFQSGKYFVVFRLTAAGRLEWADKHPYGGTFQIGEQAGETVLTVHDQEYGQPSAHSAYAWDAAAQTVLRQDIGYDFAGVEREAERLLFQERDFPAVIALLEKFLAEAPPEPHIRLDGEQYAPPWYFPALRYLLGLAYEMNGQPDQAVTVYYALMHDYPDHPFGRAAADKGASENNFP